MYHTYHIKSVATPAQATLNRCHAFIVLDCCPSIAAGTTSPSPVPRTCDGVLAERWMPRPHRGRMPQHLRGETCTSRCICICRRGSSSLQTGSRWTKTLSGTCITWRKGTSTPAFAYLMGHGPMETCGRSGTKSCTVTHWCGRTWSFFLVG